MKTAAMVRFSHSKRLLEMWLKYYSRYFDDLYVFACELEGYDVYDEMGGLDKKYKFEIIGSDKIYSVQAHQAVFDKQEELLRDHEWVIYTDIDEFVIPSSKYKDLREFMENTKRKQAFCMGYEVFMGEGENLIDYGKPPILKQRKYWYRDITGTYNKPVLSRIKSDWSVGFHKLLDMSDEDVKKIDRTGLYMVHLKHIDNNEILKENKDLKRRIPHMVRSLI